MLESLQTGSSITCNPQSDGTTQFIIDVAIGSPNNWAVSVYSSSDWGNGGPFSGECQPYFVENFYGSGTTSSLYKNYTLHPGNYCAYLAPVTTSGGQDICTFTVSGSTTTTYKCKGTPLTCLPCSSGDTGCTTDSNCGGSCTQAATTYKCKGTPLTCLPCSSGDTGCTTDNNCGSNCPVTTTTSSCPPCKPNEMCVPIINSCKDQTMVYAAVALIAVMMIMKKKQSS